MKRLCSAALFAIILTGAVILHAEIYKQVRISYPDKPVLLKIVQLGLEPIAGQAGTYLDFAIPEHDMPGFIGLGIPYTVIHDDLTAFYQSRNPVGTTMGGYRTFLEMVAVMDSLANAYPNFCTPKFHIATTTEGRSIWVMKISDNPNIDEDETELFVSGLIHAREPITGEICLEFMRYILVNYGTDAIATDLINNYELFFCPVLNPDGYEYNRQTDPGGGGMWRKNRRNNGDGSYGIDLNRNFSYFWGYDNNGSSPYTGDETYRGLSPASEPEISGVQDFINSHNFALVLNYHAYGNYFLFPWGYYDAQCDDYSFYDTLAAYAQSVGYSVGAPWQLLYNTNGDIGDWGYGEDRLHKKTFSEVIEVGGDADGFWPPQNRIAPLIQQNIGIMKDLLPRGLASYRRRLPQMPTVVSPSAATPDSPFYLHWQGSTTDTFNLATSYRVTTLADYSRATQTFETTSGYSLDGFTRNNTIRHSGTYSAFSGTGVNNIRYYVTIAERLKVQDGDSLTFWTRYSLEPDYDYAYVQVSTDGGVSWWEIEGNLSTTTNPHRHNKGFGITGSSSGNWVRGVFPLGTYAGQEIKIRFAYWTDASVTSDGIYIDDIYPCDTYATSAVLAENVNAESLLVGPYVLGTRWFKVESRDANSQIGPPSERFQVSLQGDVFALNGHVALSNSPGDLSGTIVSITSLGLADTTDTSGSYSLQTIPQGTYNINAAHAGYYPDTVFAFVLSHDSTLSFNLEHHAPDDSRA